DGTGRHAGVLEPVEEVEHIPLARPGGDLGVERVLVAPAGDGGGEAAVAGELRPAHRAAERAELGVGLYRDRDPAVGVFRVVTGAAGVGFVGRAAGVMVAEAGAVAVVQLQVHQGLADLGDQVLGLGEVDELALAGTVAVVEGGDGGEGGGDAGGGVHVVGVAGRAGVEVGIAAQPGQAGERL